MQNLPFQNVKFTTKVGMNNDERQQQANDIFERVNNVTFKTLSEISQIHKQMGLIVSTDESPAYYYYFDGKNYVRGNEFSTQNVSVNDPVIKEILNNKLDKNYFISTEISQVQGAYIDYGTGEISKSENALYSDYTYIKNASIIEYQTELLNNVAAEIAFYDSNKIYLKNISIAGTTHSKGEKVIIDLTESKYNNAYYIRLSGYGKGVINKYKWMVKPLKNYYNLITNDDVIIKIPPEANHFNKDSVLLGYQIYIDGSITPQSNSCTSDKILVKGYKNIYISNLPIYEGYLHNCFFYDEMDKPIGKVVTINQHSIQKRIEVPENAYYFRITLYQKWESGSKDFSQVVINTTNFSDYIKYENYFGGIKNYPIYDKEYLVPEGTKMLIFGDSITTTATMEDDGSNYIEGVYDNWPLYTTRYLNITKFKNYALSGASWKDQSSEAFRKSVSNQINLAISNTENDNADIIVCSLGTNDGDRSLGSYEVAMGKETIEELDRGLLYEAIRWALWSLRTKYPKALCFITTPLERAAWEIQPKLRNAIIEMGNRYNFIVIDSQNESGIVRENEWKGKHTLLKDGLHPNPEGSERLGKLYANKILGYYKIV